MGLAGVLDHRWPRLHSAHLGDEIKRWWIRRRVAARAARAEKLPSTAIAGIPELERCHAAFVEYIASCSDHYPIGQQDLAATQKFLPHLHDLCRVLNEQGIACPAIRRGITFTGTGEWGEFLAKLWAARHDIEQARRVYQGERT